MFGTLDIWNALDGFTGKRLSSRQCVKQAINGLFNNNYAVCLRKIELNGRFIQFYLNSIFAHGVTAKYRIKGNSA